MDNPEFDRTPQPASIGDRYKIVRTLGRGGMATVYEAIDEVSQKSIAVKQLHTHRLLGNGYVARLFELEYHTLSQLVHPRVVEVYDYQKHDDGVFYTMELLDGGDLREAQVMPWKVVCSVLYDICSALSLLHSRRLVHRDITPRNIRRTHDGKAKLIDFGAMVPFGTHKNVVGTPSFTAPEVVTAQPLDARADLYSIGATAYYALTGRHAYPARSFAKLRNAWRSQPAVPSRYTPDIPADFDQLIMSLLSLSPSRRPTSVAAVMERLTAIAGLQVDEQLRVKRAFLSTPSLVGRDDVLRQVRRTMIRAVHGKGSSIFITGPRGVGLSRMVDACALEGKLASAIVLRADASDAQDGDWGGVCSLLDQLETELSSKIRVLLRPYIAVLVHVWPRAAEFADEDQPVNLSNTGNLRPQVQRALLKLMEDISFQSSLVITADDIDRIDEPTGAFIALLAQQLSFRRIVIVVAAAREALDSGERWLQLMRDEIPFVELNPLSIANTEKLLISSFGEVPNVRLLASHLHDMSSGLPAAIMQLSQHLLDNNVVRFHDGSWLLPNTIDHDTLPTSLSDALQARVNQLDNVSRELAQTMALSHKPAFTLQECGQLLGESDWSKVLRSLDSLVMMQIVSIIGTRYALSQQKWTTLLLADMDPERKQELHSRIAEMYKEEPGAEFHVAGHFLAAGNNSHAVDMLLQYIECVGKELNKDPTRLPEHIRSLPSDWMHTLETAIAAAEQLSRPYSQQLALKMLLLQRVAVVAEPRNEIAKEIIDQLIDDSGLGFYETLSDTMASGERLKLSIQMAKERFNKIPEMERGLPPSEAIPQLARAIIQIIGMAGAAWDLKFLQTLPSLEPFIPLSPAFAIVQRNLECTRHILAGRSVQAHEGNLDILAHMEVPGGIGLTPAVHRYMQLAVTFSTALIETASCHSNAIKRINILESDPLFEVNAWRLRKLYALKQGDLESADMNGRKSELLMIQNHPSQFFEGADVWPETVAYAEIGDVARIRQTIERLDAFAARFNKCSWTLAPMYAQGYIRLLRGEAQAAAEIFENALSKYKAGDSLTWTSIARGYLIALTESGRAQEAFRVGTAMLEQARAAELTILVSDLLYAMAKVELARKEYDAALAHLESLAKIRKGWPLGKVFSGACYELQARIALGMRKPEAFYIAVKLCGKHFLSSRNPILIARHQRLLQDAERVGFRLPSSPASSINPKYDEDSSEDTVTKVGGKKATLETIQIFNKCDSFNERVERVLSIVVEVGLGEHIMLYLLRDNLPTFVGQRGKCPETADMEHLVTSFFKEEIEEPDSMNIDPDDMVTSTVDNSEWMGPTGVQFVPVLLSHMDADRLAITGVLVLSVEHLNHPEDSLLADLSIALTNTTDVVPFLLEKGKSEH